MRRPITSRRHGMLDYPAGILLIAAPLAASPWLFGFADDGTNAWLPHLAAGLALVATGLLTQPERAGGAVVTRDVRSHGSPRTG